MKNLSRLLKAFLNRHESLRKIARKMHYKVQQVSYNRKAPKYEIDDKIILFESFMGRQYACNPRAIYEDIINDPSFNDYKLVWAFIDCEDKRNIPALDRAECVTYKSEAYYQYCATAKYIVTNSNLDFGISKKEEQVIVQTWHGTPLKRLRCDIEVEHGNANNTLEEIFWKNDIDIVRYDYFLSPSKFASEKFTTAFRLKELDKENILYESGYPRNDFLSRYTAEDVLKIKKYLGIEGVNKKIILYAPTFRDNQHKAGVGYVYKPEVDFDRLQRELGDEYIILFRPHYFVANHFDFDKYKGFVYDVTEIDDIKELYIITDLLLTDYSSVFFDYAVLKRPMLFYMYDLEEYADDIRGFYLDLEELPGDIVKTEDDLIAKIKEGNFAYDGRYQKFNEKFTYLEDGYAGRRLINEIFELSKAAEKVPDVVVLSRNYSTGLGIIRSLGAAGYNVDLVASTKKKGSSIIASCSKYVRKAVEVMAPDIQKDSGEGLIKAMLEMASGYDGKAVLFPTDDFTASVVDANRETLKEYFVMPKAERPVTEMMDKTFQSKIAREAGLNTPEEWIVPLNDKVTIPADVIYPCFVKPLKSVAGHKTEMAVCSSSGELKAHLMEMKKRFSDRDVLVQEYLNIEKEYAFSGVCLGENAIIPGVIEKMQIAQYEKGVAVTGKLLPVSILGEAEQKIRTLLKRFNYTGMFDMDLILSNGKLYFSEVNLRSGGSNYAYYLNGVNLPDIFIKEVCGQGHESSEELIREFGKTFVYEKVAWEDFIYGFITKKELDAILAGADYTLLTNNSDPEPGNCFNRRIRLSAMKHKTKRALKKETLTDRSAELMNGEKTSADFLVVGNNYCNILTMVRDLGEAGYDSEVLRIYKTKPHKISPLSRMRPDAYSKYVKMFRECIVKNDFGRALKKLMKMADKDHKKILMPVDDYAAYVVDMFMEELKPYYIMPGIEDRAGEIIHLMDKAEQKKLALQFEIPVLNSTLVKSKGGKVEISDEISYPCYIKPNTSMKSNKGKMARCDSKMRLEDTLVSYAENEDIEFLVEDFADIRTEYSLVGLSMKEDVRIPGLFRVNAGGNKERKGVAISGQIVPCGSFEDIINRCKKMVSSLNYNGLFGIDLIETKDGKVFFIELNFRAGASSRVFTEAGVNLPEIYAEYIMNGKAPQTECGVKGVGTIFVSEKVLLEEYVRSDVSRRTVRKHMKNADVFFIKNELDPKPYEHFKKYYRMARLLRAPYKVKDFINKK